MRNGPQTSLYRFVRKPDAVQILFIGQPFLMTLWLVALHSGTMQGLG